MSQDKETLQKGIHKSALILFNKIEGKRQNSTMKTPFNKFKYPHTDSNSIETSTLIFSR